MNLRTFGLPVVAALLTAAAITRSEDKTRDSSVLNGTWKVVAVDFEHFQFDPPHPQSQNVELCKDLENGMKADLTFAFDGLYATSIDKKNKGTCAYKLNPTANPKTIDVVAENGRPATGLGLYQVDGSKIKVCIAPAHQPRPTQLVSTPTTFVIVLERQPQ